MAKMDATLKNLPYETRFRNMARGKGAEGSAGQAALWNGAAGLVDSGTKLGTTLVDQAFDAQFREELASVDQATMGIDEDGVAASSAIAEMDKESSRIKTAVTTGKLTQEQGEARLATFHRKMNRRYTLTSADPNYERIKASAARVLGYDPIIRQRQRQQAEQAAAARDAKNRRGDGYTNAQHFQVDKMATNEVNADGTPIDIKAFMGKSMPAKLEQLAAVRSVKNEMEQIKLKLALKKVLDEADAVEADKQFDTIAMIANQGEKTTNQQALDASIQALQAPGGVDETIAKQIGIQAELSWADRETQLWNLMNQKKDGGKSYVEAFGETRARQKIRDYRETFMAPFRRALNMQKNERLNQIGVLKKIAGWTTDGLVKSKYFDPAQQAVIDRMAIKYGGKENLQKLLLGTLQVGTAQGSDGKGQEPSLDVARDAQILREIYKGAGFGMREVARSTVDAIEDTKRTAGSPKMTTEAVKKQALAVDESMPFRFPDAKVEATNAVVHEDNDSLYRQFGSRTASRRKNIQARVSGIKMVAGGKNMAREIAERMKTDEEFKRRNVRFWVKNIGGILNDEISDIADERTFLFRDGNEWKIVRDFDYNGKNDVKTVAARIWYGLGDILDEGRGDLRQIEETIQEIQPTLAAQGFNDNEINEIIMATLRENGVKFVDKQQIDAMIEAGEARAAKQEEEGTTRYERQKRASAIQNEGSGGSAAAGRRKSRGN